MGRLGAWIGATCAAWGVVAGIYFAARVFLVALAVGPP
jgi:hypothetical protein